MGNGFFYVYCFLFLSYCSSVSIILYLYFVYKLFSKHILTNNSSFNITSYFLWTNFVSMCGLIHILSINVAQFIYFYRLNCGRVHVFGMVFFFLSIYPSTRSYTFCDDYDYDYCTVRSLSVCLFELTEIYVYYPCFNSFIVSHLERISATHTHSEMMAPTINHLYFTPPVCTPFHSSSSSFYCFSKQKYKQNNKRKKNIILRILADSWFSVLYKNAADH